MTSAEVLPVLASDNARVYPEITNPLIEKTVVVEERASALVIMYSSDAEIEMRISFPSEMEKGMTYNPLRTLQWKNVPPGNNRKVTLDLTQSPAWSPGRDLFLLHVVGSPGTVITIHDIDRMPVSIGKTIAAAFKQIGVNEPVIFSSINTLEGYRALGISVSLIYGLVFIIVLIVLGINFQPSVILMASLAFLLLYDVRFSFDLLKTSARDLSEWTEKGEYRQLGPLFQIADLLRSDGSTIALPMKVSVCLALDDIYLKQLRYHLYPAPVRHSKELWEDATHLVLIGIPKEPKEDGTMVCEEGQTPRKVTLLKAFDEGTKVYRFESNL